MEKAEETTPDFIKVPRFARRLGIARSAAYNGVRTGEIPAIKVCGTWLIHKSVLDEIIAQATKRP